MLRCGSCSTGDPPRHGPLQLVEDAVETAQTDPLPGVLVGIAQSGVVAERTLKRATSRADHHIRCALVTHAPVDVPLIGVGEEVTGRFYFNATNGLTGKCIVTGWNPSVAVEGAETQTLNVQGSSDLTYF